MVGEGEVHQGNPSSSLSTGLRLQTQIPDEIAWVGNFTQMIEHTFQMARCQSNHLLVACHCLVYKGKT